MPQKVQRVREDRLGAEKFAPPYRLASPKRPLPTHGIGHNDEEKRGSENDYCGGVISKPWCLLVCPVHEQMAVKQWLWGMSRRGSPPYLSPEEISEGWILPCEAYRYRSCAVNAKKAVPNVDVPLGVARALQCVYRYSPLQGMQLGIQRLSPSVAGGMDQSELHKIHRRKGVSSRQRRP